MICHYLPDTFEDTVRSMWCKYVTACGVDYSEEQVSSQSPNHRYMASNDDDREPMERVPNFHIDNIRTDNPYRSLPRLPITLALLYLACVHCSIPVTLSEVRIWAVRGVIPYASTLNILTEEERRSLKRTDQRRFERVVIPSMHELFSVSARLSGFLARYQHCPLPFQEPIILVWKHLDRVGLPLDLYPIVMRLLKRIGNGIEYRICRLAHRNNPNAEISVMASVVFIVKLLYGLCGNKQVSHKSYYEKLVKDHGLPKYEELLESWQRRLRMLKQDFLLNNHSVLHWCDLRKFVQDAQRHLPSDRSRLMTSYFEEFPDLMTAIENVPSMYQLPAQSNDSVINSFANNEVDFVRVISRRMANNCLVYHRDVHRKRIHKEFRVLLELAALSINVPFHDLYREYHRLFHLFPPKVPIVYKESAQIVEQTSVDNEDCC